MTSDARSLASDANATAGDSDTIARAIVHNLYYRQGRVPEFATRNEWYTAVALTVHDRLVDPFVKTGRVLAAQNAKIVSSRARYTSPMPPAPIGARTS